ncbi:ThiF family protein [Dictyocaulus viviparus]|uniref:Adenylyltransferase and sulfurtransferase MOCS3 homolog n=1 Tax=Dictyocaulus viviparus TaxID=29172 RepID=A0A0D8XXN0_DICVI|nr:ThiF family protein [Dictyocaulus viviparus]
MSNWIRLYYFLNTDVAYEIHKSCILNCARIVGQQGVSSAKVVIIGAGGLGCPVAMYLSGAGVHTLGIVDYDEVAIDNLHRQIAHKEMTVGKSKVESLRDYIIELNSSVNVAIYNIILDRYCALDILRLYDIVVDCSDNPATRYLLNDACVLLGKPLVSGSALRWEGQLSVYNYIDRSGERGPCYRCLFPIPASPSHITNCNEGGVFGPVVGVIGSLQALEVMKIAGGLKPNFSSKLYLFDGSSGKSRTVVIRPRNKECVICGDNPKVTELVDYELFCNSGACDKVQKLSILSSDDRVSVSEYFRIRSSGHKPILLDTRPAHEFSIASLDEAINIPLDEVRQLDTLSISERLGLNSDPIHSEMFVICHRGNDSQLAVEILRNKLPFIRIRDIRDGYEAWASEVDENFPRY